MDEAYRLALPAPGPRHTHYLFRYPAKFHPPVVQALLERFTEPGQLVVDNFCGSGTSLVEASIGKRRSIGVDIDPVAVLVSQGKTRRYDTSALQRDAMTILSVLRKLERPEAEYDRRTFVDLTDDEYRREIGDDDLHVPSIPRLAHWFRRYVIVDLARIKRVLLTANIQGPSRSLFFLVFAGIIRNVSNADPVPVSGLEVTAHMLRKEAAGRRINPVEAYRATLKKALTAASTYSDLIDPEFVPRVVQGDATSLPADVTGIDAVIASPPYHNAVDYYRRHQLEMFWLDLVKTAADRLALLPRYIGRHRIPKKHTLLQEDWRPGKLAAHWYERIGVANPQRAGDFRHYLVSMQRVFEDLRFRMNDGAPVVLVVGESAWAGEQLPTAELLAEAAGSCFKLEQRYWYPIRNRYMSYTRHNGADIGHEYALVFR